jgi:hypothetical protein
MKFFPLAVILLFTFRTEAKHAPKHMSVFNKTCPAPALCYALYNNLESCEKENNKTCAKFIYNLRKALPEYDCQRTAEKNSSEKYIVPALWLCDGHDRYLDALSKLKSKKAKMLYGSKLFRSALDGATAEDHFKKSKRVEELNSARKLSNLSQGESE